MLQGEKSPLASAGLWGSTIAGVGGLDLLLKYFDLVKEGLPPVIQAGVVLFGAVVSFWGRLKATKKIG